MELGVDPEILDDEDLKYTEETGGRATCFKFRRTNWGDDTKQREKAYQHLILNGELPDDFHKILTKVYHSPSSSVSDLLWDREVVGRVYEHLKMVLENADLFDTYVSMYAPELPSWHITWWLDFATSPLSDWISTHPTVIRRLLWGHHGISASDLVTVQVGWTSPEYISIWTFIASVWTDRSEMACTSWLFTFRNLARRSAMFSRESPYSHHPKKAQCRKLDECWRDLEWEWSLYSDLVRDLASISNHKHVAWRPSKPEGSALFWVLLEGCECSYYGKFQSKQRKHFQRVTGYTICSRVV